MVKRGVNLWNPEQIKDFMARQEKWSKGRKVNVMYAYESFIQMENLTWQRPRYRHTRSKQPFVPTESEIDLLIKACRKNSAYSFKDLRKQVQILGSLQRVNGLT